MANILKEIHSDIGSSICDDGDLTPWAKQGVLLINTILTVEDSSPKSHQKQGWETFTDNIIKYISENNEKNVITVINDSFLIISSNSTGFISSPPFQAVKTFLIAPRPVVKIKRDHANPCAIKDILPLILETMEVFNTPFDICSKAFSSAKDN